MTAKLALVVVNENSRSGDAVDLEPFVDTLKKAGITAEVETLNSFRTLEHLLRARKTLPDMIVVAGGDGTVRATADSLLECDRPFGVLPLGTANDLARGLGIPTDPGGAAEVIARGRTCRIDVGAANEVHFFNVAGIGMGPAMTREMDSAEKSRWGVFAYLKALFRAMRKRGTFKATITCNGERLRIRALQLNVANGKYYGGGMTACEETRQDDGMLDLVVVKAVGVMQLLRLAPKLRWGRVEHEPELVVRHADRIHVATRKPMNVSTDGELTTRTPATFTVLPGRLRVFVSAEADAVDCELSEAEG